MTQTPQDANKKPRKHQRYPTLGALTRKERRMLEAAMRKWERKLKPMHDAIEESTRITAEDLRIIVR